MKTFAQTRRNRLAAASRVRAFSVNDLASLDAVQESLSS